MKPFLILLLLILGITNLSFAQFDSLAFVHPGDSSHNVYLQKRAEMFEDVDFTNVPSGVLYEWGFPFIDLNYFQGNLSEESKSSRISFSLAFASMASMQVGATDLLPPPAAYRSVLDTISSESNVIYLTGLHRKYHKLDSLSVIDSLLALSGHHLSDVFPRPRSPYIEQDLFLFAPAVNHVSSNSFNFKLDSNLFFTNTNKIISSIEIDLGNGVGYFGIQFNQNIPVVYDSAGVKNIKIKIVYTDSSTFYSHFDFRTTGSGTRTPEILPDIVHYIAPNNDFPEVFQGRGGGTINVFLGCGHSRIEKPFIWAEGYNPLVGKLDLRLNKKEFLERIDHPLTEDEYEKSLWDHLLENGYDIILLDYDDGGDYLPRNAEFIKESLRWINLQKYSAGSNEKNIVIGQSMGGVCSMLALKEMEVISEEDHEVGTFIVFDSPIMGVNVPLLGQASLIDICTLPVHFTSRYLFEYIPELEDALRLLYLPATVTMVKYFIKVDGIPEEIHLYEDFYDYLHNGLGGMPEQCEVLTIANGSRFGTDGKHDFEPGELVFSPAVRSLSVIQLLGGLASSSGPDEPFDYVKTAAVYAVLGVITWKVGLNVNINIKGYAVPDMALGIYYESQILVKILSDTLVYSAITVKVSDVPGIDCAPGGFVGMGNQGIILDDIELIEHIPLVFKLQTWCFTPTGSVLNYHGPYTDNRFHDPLHNFENNPLEISSGNTRDVNNYISNSSTPIFGGEIYKNTAHTWFTQENTQFLKYHLCGIDMLEGISSLSLGETFNYGKSQLLPLIDYEESSPRLTRSILDESLIVDNTYLAVNSNDKIGLTPSPYIGADIPSYTPAVSSFLLNIGNVCESDEPIILTIQNNGQLILGDGITRTGAVHLQSGHTIVVKDGGILRINEGGTLKIKTGGVLNIEEGGTVIIENGGYLITEYESQFLFHEGADIHLLGEEAVMELAGNLYLFPDADFNPKHDGVSSGRVIWKYMANLDGGTGSKFQIIGDNDDDPMLTIAEGAAINAGPLMALLRFANCKVSFRTNKSFAIRSFAPFQSSNVSYEVQSNLVEAGFHPKIKLYKKSLIHNSTFTDVFLRTEPYGDVGDGVFLNISNSEFNSTYNKIENQVYMIGGNLSMSFCEFTGFSGIALKMDHRTSFSGIYYSSFIGGGSHTSEAIVDASGSELLVKNCIFENGLRGITHHYGQLTLRCNSFTDFNDFAILGGGYSRVEMSSNLNAGYNTFDNIEGHNVWLDQAQFLSINSGYNYFAETGSGRKIIKGTFIYPIPAFLVVPGFKNQWNVANTVPVSEFEIVHHDTWTPINYSLLNPASTSCGYNNPSSPIVDVPGGGGSYLPTINLTGVSSPMKLDTAISFVYKSSTAWTPLANDLSAIQMYQDILMHQYSPSELANPVVGFLLNTAYQQMKHTVGRAIADSVITKGQNQSAFSSPIQKFVDVLNFRSMEDTISLNNYIPQFYLELDKANLLRTLGHVSTGFDILKNTDLCQLDSAEQVVMNQWKLVFEEEFTKQQIGISAYEVDSVFTDVSGYYAPINSQATEYYFGSVINSPTNITFRSCSGARSYENNDDKKSFPLKVYPNPSNGEIRFDYELPSASQGQIVIYTIDGKEITRVDLQDGQRSKLIDISSVQSGIYLYKLFVNGESVNTGKISIVH